MVGHRRRRARGQPGAPTRCRATADLVIARRHPADRLHDRLAVALRSTRTCASRRSTSSTATRASRAPRRCVADAKLALAALRAATRTSAPREPWGEHARSEKQAWLPVRARGAGAARPTTPISQGELIGALNESARPGDTIIAAAGGPPGDLQKVWDATGERAATSSSASRAWATSCPRRSACGSRRPDGEVIALIGDGTFLMQPTELATAAQEGLKVTVVISDNHGYQVIRRLQMHATGRHFGNEMRYRAGSPSGAARGRLRAARPRSPSPRARRHRVRRRPRDEVLDALARARESDGPVVIVVPTAPHENLPAVRRVVGRRTRRRVVAAVAGGEAPRPTRQASRPSGGTDDPARPAPGRRADARDVPQPRLAARGRGVRAGRLRLAADRPRARRRREDALVGQLLAAAAHGVPALVRVESAERIRAGRVLDAGAAGVMFPRMDTARAGAGRARPPALSARGRPRRRDLQPRLRLRAPHRGARQRQRRGHRRDPDRERRRRSSTSRRSPGSRASTSCSSARATSRMRSACPAGSTPRSTAPRSRASSPRRRRPA